MCEREIFSNLTWSDITNLRTDFISPISDDDDVEEEDEEEKEEAERNSFFIK